MHGQPWTQWGWDVATRVEYGRLPRNVIAVITSKQYSVQRTSAVVTEES